MTKPSKPRVRLNPVSAKQLAKRLAAGESFLRSSVRPTALRDAQSRELSRRSPVAKQNAARRKKEFERAYGGTARVEWVKTCACVSCGARQQIEVSHIVTGGMGRKANASRTVPMCSWCHAEFHRGGRVTFERTFSVNLDALAEQTEAAWQEYASQHPTRQRGRSA